jgi:hypothetical protein
LNVQFDDIAPAAEELANQGKIVIVAALNCDFQRKVRILDFYSCSSLSGIQFRSAVISIRGEDREAECGLSMLRKFCVLHDADGELQRGWFFTSKVYEPLNFQRELIGGADMYQAMCRNCYHEVQGSVTP